MNGVERIAAERQRQIDVEGWTADHDDCPNEEHALVFAAVCYALPQFARRMEDEEGPPAEWPWEPRWWKPGDRIRELEKAGALIAAEIDRLLRNPDLDDKAAGR